MSGTNPFRRKGTAEQSFNGQVKAIDHVPVSSNPDAHIPPINTDFTNPPKTKTVKTVRIISPHSADIEQHRGMPDEIFDSSQNALSSPPPEPASASSSDEESPEDPFGADSEGPGSSTEDENTRLNTMKNASGAVKEHQSPAGMPANPFKKTLASSESVDSTTSQHSAAGSTTALKPQYDVDDFKRLLLTGEKSVNKSGAPPVSFGQLPNGDSSSNTDASSLSRQSIFEPVSSVSHESPRTSQEITVSDDEKQQLVEVPPAKSNKPKPSAPRHRHGKLVKANAPQIVSFEDPALSFAGAEGPLSSLNGPSSPTSPTILNSKERVSPPLFSSSISSQFHVVPATPTSITGKDVPETDFHKDPKGSLSRSNSEKRVAPAPPPTRRQSQRRPMSMSSQRSLPISEEAMEESTQALSSSPNSLLNAPPPPPPPRRSNVGRGNPSSTPIAPPATGGTDQLTLDDPHITPFKARPEGPTRSPVLSATKSSSRTSPASGSPSMAPPPPPPPRRRTSSQSSYTPSRLSGNYTAPTAERLRSDSGASSISQIPMTNLESTSEAQDVMADLTALQREVDELRGKMKS